jgi:putative spermidine/putrescine transport system permease protein
MRGLRVSPLRIFAVLVGLLLLVPTLMVIPMSFTAGSSFHFPPEGWSLRWYRSFFSDPAWRDSLMNSLWIGFLVTILATTLGTASAYALARSRVLGRGAARGLHLAPQIVPNIVVAVAIYAAFLNWGLTGTVLGFVLAHTVLAVPFVVVAVSTSLAGMDVRLELAAASLGANPWQTFFRVTLPAIAPGVLSGAVFAFATSFDEVVVALFLRTPELQTLPVQMFNAVRVEIDPTIAAASSLIVLVTVVALAIGMFLRPPLPPTSDKVSR